MSSSSIGIPDDASIFSIRVSIDSSCSDSVRPLTSTSQMESTMAWRHSHPSSSAILFDSRRMSLDQAHIDSWHSILPNLAFLYPV